MLERYLLPALPVLYAAFAMAFEALSPPLRRSALAGMIACLAAAAFINPVYPFPLENNLAFAGFVALEQSAAAAVEARGGGSVAAAFPLSDALRRPELGFVERLPASQ